MKELVKQVSQNNHMQLSENSGDPDSQREAGREHHKDAPVYANARCLNVILTTGRLTRVPLQELWL